MLEHTELSVLDIDLEGPKAASRSMDRLGLMIRSIGTSLMNSGASRGTPTLRHSSGTSGGPPYNS